MTRERAAARPRPTAGVAAPADRRYRRSAGVPVRRRRGLVVWVARLRWVATAVVMLAAGAWGVGRVLASDMFLVRDITIRGNHHLSIGEIELLVDGLQSERVFAVDFETYRRRLLDSPWVADVSMARVLPATIVIDVVERTPVALARLNQRLYLVDDSGTIIDEYRADYQEFDLPIVDGLAAEADGESAGGSDPDRAALVAAMLTDLDGRPGLTGRLSQIDVSSGRDVLVMLDDDPAWLHLGRERFEERLQRYLDLRPALQDRFGAIDYVDLKFDERVYVRGRNERRARSAGME